MKIFVTVTFVIFGLLFSFRGLQAQISQTLIVNTNAYVLMVDENKNTTIETSTITTETIETGIYNFVLGGNSSGMEAQSVSCNGELGGSSELRDQTLTVIIHPLETVTCNIVMGKQMVSPQMYTLYLPTVSN